MEKVFAAHKDVKEIFVVDGVPFLKKSHALNHAGGDEKKVKIVKRGASEKVGKSNPEADELKAFKAQAKELKIKGYGKMKVDELKEAIEAAQADDVDGEPAE